MMAISLDRTEIADLLRKHGGEVWLYSWLQLPVVDI